MRPFRPVAAAVRRRQVRLVITGQTQQAFRLKRHAGTDRWCQGSMPAGAGDAPFRRLGKIDIAATRTGAATIHGDGYYAVELRSKPPGHYPPNVAINGCGAHLS